MRVKNIIGCALLIITHNATNAQNWQNPSEKYKDAYKKYTSAKCPIAQDSIQHFVYFARDRESMRNHSFLKHLAFKGAQIMYAICVCQRLFKSKLYVLGQSRTIL